MISINYLLCTMNLNIYGFIVGIAAVMWWSLAEYLEPKLKKYIPWLLIAALVGARIYHVVDYLEYYSLDWRRVFYVWEGGLSIWGAIIAGLIGIKFTIANLQLTKDEKANFVSAIVTPLPVAQAIGRLANGVNGEFTNRVLGVPWWGMEAGLNLGLFGVIWLMPKRLRVWGYLVGYGLIRLALEPYR